MRQMMIDLETFGPPPNATVIQIGACKFDITTGEIGDMFFENVDARKEQLAGSVIDADTVYWWLNQIKNAQKHLQNPPPCDPKEVLYKLNNFLDGVTSVWSHVTFDHVVIMEMYRRHAVQPMINFRMAKDLRTITHLASMRKKDFEDMTRVGVHHNALHDCIFQVMYTTLAYNKLRGGDDYDEGRLREVVIENAKRGISDSYNQG